MVLVANDNKRHSDQLTQFGTLSRNISSLYKDYSNYSSTYTGLIEYSTMLTGVIRQSTIALNMYSTLYDSTTAVITKLYTESNVTLKQLVSTQVNIDTYSTLIERHSANLLVYAANLDASYAQQECGTMKYRETIIREKHIAAQRDYDRTIIDEIQKNSTNGITTATNLNTPAISIAYTTLKTVEEHVNKYSEIYDLYNLQSTNQGLMISTTMGYSNSYTTLLSSQMAAKIYPNDTVVIERRREREIVYNVCRQAVQQRESAVKLGYDDIYVRKRVNDATYNTLFSPSQINANTSTISSFLIQGYSAVIELSKPPPTPEQLSLRSRAERARNLVNRAKRIRDDAVEALRLAVQTDASNSNAETRAAVEVAEAAAQQAADDVGVAQSEADETEAAATAAGA
jgi:hypothetical protein